MKKSILTKMTFLALAFLCLGTGNAWGVEWSIDFSQITGEANKTSATISDEVSDGLGTVTIGSTALNSNFGLQTGTSWLYYTNGRLYQFNSGGRNFGVFNAIANQLITLNSSAAPTPTNATLKSTNGNVRVYTVTADGTVIFNLARYKDIYSITVANPSTNTADYTVKYVDADGNELKSATTNSGEINTAITLSDDEKASFYNEEKTVKYIYVSDDSEGKKIASDGTTIVTVKFREAAKYNYTVKNNLSDAILYSGIAFEEDKVSVSYPLYVNVDGTLYTKAATDKSYSASFTPDADNYVYTLTYTVTDITNVVYFSEAENIVGATATSAGGNMTIRSSNQMCAYAESDITLINLPAGVYKATSVQYSNSTAGLTLTYQIGTETVDNVTSGASNWDTKTNEFTLPAAADFKWLTSGAAKSGLDFIYIQKIGEYTYTKTLSATGFASFSATCNVTVPEGTGAYKAAIDGSYVTLTPVEGVIPANTGVILYNSAKPASVTLTGTTEAATADFKDNELIPTSVVANRTVNGATDASSYTYYALNNTKSFGKITADITLSDNKAYLKVSKAAGTAAMNLSIGFSDGPTGLETVDAEAEDNVIYNVYGVRVNEDYKGLVIVNGKKYLNK